MREKISNYKRIEGKSREPYKLREESEKIKIVQEIQSGIIGIRPACRKYGLCRQTLKHWIGDLSIRNLGNELSTQVLCVMTDEEALKALNKKNEELTIALELARLKIDGLETMIKVAEEDLQIKIRKKAGTKQSRE